MVALVKPNGQMQVLAAINLTLGIDFSIDSDGRLHFDPDFTYKPYVIGISPAQNNPLPCGGKFELLTPYGAAAVADAYGFEAQYAVHQAGDCCLPWDFNVRLLRFRSNGQQEVVQEGFQTSYCLTAQPSTDIEIEPVLMYFERDQSTGQIIKDNSGKTVFMTATTIERLEPHERTSGTSPKPIREYVLAAKIKNPNVVNSDGTYAVKINVTMKTEDSAGNLKTNPLAVPNVTLPAPRDAQGNDLKKFFSGNLVDSATGGTQTNGYQYGATLNLNVTTVNKNEPIPFVMGEVYPNQIEEPGKFVPPGEKVTKNKISLGFELAAPVANAGYSVNSNNQLKRFVTNEETYEEYYRVFKEIRDVLHFGTGNLANLSGFANNFRKELKNTDLSILKTWGKNLWDFGIAYVQNAARDDRPLYYARLEALATLRAHAKSVSVSDTQFKEFEYSSRGFETSAGTGGTLNVKIPLDSTSKQNVIVTGFDPFQLHLNPTQNNTSGIIALGIYNTHVELGNVNSAKVASAVFPVRWKDFDERLVEKVMEAAVKEKSLSMIMTTSWTPLPYFRVDRFATKNRTQGSGDNENIPAPTIYSVASGPTYLESSLPYDFPGVLTNSAGTENRKLTSNGSYLVLDQHYVQGGVTKLDFVFGDPVSFKRAETDLPSPTPDVTSGSGGSYLSNEIFYRTALVRETNEKGLPTGHLHVRRLEQNLSWGVTTAMSGDDILNGGRESLQILLGGVRRIVFDDTQINSSSVKSVTIHNTRSNPVTINSNNLSLLPGFELISPTGNFVIPSNGSQVLSFRFTPTAMLEYKGFAQLRNGTELIYRIELVGKGIYLPPTITAVRAPSPATVGAKITIEGTNFVNNLTTVKIGGVMAAPVTFIDSTKIEVNLPSLPGGSVPNVEVTTPGGSAFKPGGFTVASSLPVFSSPAFSPSSGGVGTTVDIFGSAFDDVTEVKIGGIAAAFTKINSTHLRATIPAGAASSFIEVVTPSGTVTSAELLTIIPAPFISSFNPSMASAGGMVDIYGQNFDGATEVRIGNAVPFTIVSPTQITATVTEYVYDSTIEVVTPGGTATSTEQFALIPPPYVSFFTPQSGPMGTAIDIYGQNLGSTTGVRIGDPVMFSVVSPNQISATAPGVIGTFPIEIETLGGTVTTIDQFTVTFNKGGDGDPFPTNPWEVY